MFLRYLVERFSNVGFWIDDIGFAVLIIFDPILYRRYRWVTEATAYFVIATHRRDRTDIHRQQEIRIIGLETPKIPTFQSSLIYFKAVSEAGNLLPRYFGC